MRSDADQADCSERLWPSPGILAVTIGFGTALGLIPAPVSTPAAVIVAALGCVGLVTLLLATTPTVRVTADEFVAGRAHVPLSVVRGIEVLDPEQMRQARGLDLDARAYLCTRGWIPTGAKVILDDPEDPTPYWIVSSRRPEALAAAVATAVHRTGRLD